ncbi:MAG: ADP-ribosylglycohydrolase family protein [Thioploca sp.]|nr:ADP-ribosylglycohydrolase family protein [Thioploca sp.]
MGERIKTLASSLWCFWKYPDFYKKAVITAIKMGGDADTRGAIVGALVGNRVGVENIPKEYIEVVEQSDLLTALDKILWIGPTLELKSTKN